MRIIFILKRQVFFLLRKKDQNYATSLLSKNDSLKYRGSPKILFIYDIFLFQRVPKEIQCQKKLKDSIIVFLM